MPDQDRSSRLDMPYMLPAQAQKHVTHNEALQILDALVQLCVTSFDAQTPPAQDAQIPEGQVHALGLSPVGDWAGQPGKLALRTGQSWTFVSPQPGWQAHDLQTGGTYVFRDGIWQALLHDVESIGIGTAADTTNRLSVASPASLFSHAGDSHRMVLNKASSPDTASLLFQSGWSGRAEMGLAGSEDFAIRTSANGQTFTTALQIARASGRVSLPAGVEITGPVTGSAVTAHPDDPTPGRLSQVGDFGIGLVGDNQPAALRIADASADLPSGFFSGPGSSGTNYPNSAARFFPFVNALHRAGLGSFTQARLFLAGPGSVTIGTRENSAPWSYARFYTEANVVGSVGQIAGLPTGAVIEQGSNANGHYVRFADGTQLCWTHVDQTAVGWTSASGSLFVPASAYGWTFPALFAATPTVMPSVQGSVAGAQGASVQMLSTSTAHIMPWSATPVGASTEKSIHLLATGRWF